MRALPERKKLNSFHSLQEFSSPRYKHSATGGGAFNRPGVDGMSAFLPCIVAGYNVLHQGDDRVRHAAAMSMTVAEFSFYETAVGDADDHHFFHSLHNDIFIAFLGPYRVAREASIC